MIETDLREVKRMERRLAALRHSAIPFATRDTINKMAFDSQKKARNEITDKMVLRNKFTISSVRVDRATGTNIAAQKAIMGSTADYMDEQEFGGRKKRATGKSVGIPTSFSAGLGRGARPRTKLPRAMYKMSSIALRSVGARRGKNAKQRNAISIAMSKGGYTFLDLGRRKGIFKIDKKGNPTMLHDLTRPSVNIPARKWMKPAVDEIVNKRGDYYRRALEFQIARLA